MQGKKLQKKAKFKISQFLYIMKFGESNLLLYFQRYLLTFFSPVLTKTHTQKMRKKSKL